MQMVLHFLAVIGIILLCILAFILLLALAILFLPVRYRIHFSYFEKEAIVGRFSWFFRVLHVPFSYRDGQTFYELRFLGIDLSKIFSERKKTEPKKQTSKKKAKKRDDSHETMEISQEKQNFSDNVNNPDSEQVIINTQQEPPDGAVDILTEEERKKSSKRSKNPLKKVVKTMKEAVSLLRHLWKKWLRFLKKEKELSQRIKKYITFLKDDSVSDMVCILKDNVIHLWGKLKPKKIKGYLHFGTGDPCSTGEILGLLSFLYIASRGELRIQPEFDETCFEGELEIKGRIMVFTLVWILYKVVFSEEWDKFQKAYRKVRR